MRDLEKEMRRYEARFRSAKEPKQHRAEKGGPTELFVPDIDGREDGAGSKKRSICAPCKCHELLPIDRAKTASHSFPPHTCHNGQAT